MTNLIHVMLDLETWGTAPGHDLRSIGACVFDPLTNDVASSPDLEGMGDDMFYMATDNPLIVYPEIGFMNSLEEWRRYDLDRDPATVAWWNDQSADAQAAFADPIELRVALLAFADWLCGLDGGAYHTHDGWRPSPNIRLWSHGPAFDPPILAAAFKAADMILPWHYRAPRDTRTAFDLAEIDDDGDGSYRTFMSAFNTGTHHHALDDAIAQARSVCGAYQRAGLAPDERDGPTLRKRAIEAVRAYDDWTNNNETAFTGWGDMIVPPEATKMRVDSGEALRLLTGADTLELTADMMVKPEPSTGFTIAHTSGAQGVEELTDAIAKAGFAVKTEPLPPVDEMAAVRDYIDKKF